jgi:hypothetical protein
MSNKNVGLSSKYEEVVGSSTIYITNKTVQFGEEVYQFHNMTGFGVSEIPRILLPIKLILGLFLLGLFAANFPDDAARSFGIFLIVISLVCLVYNQVQPRKYGLAIYFNSGRSRFFSTRDKEGLKAVVATLYKYMDSDKDLGTYVVNIVEGSVTGNFIGGNAHENNVNFR